LINDCDRKSPTLLLEMMKSTRESCKSFKFPEDPLFPLLLGMRAEWMTWKSRTSLVSVNKILFCDNKICTYIHIWFFWNVKLNLVSVYFLYFKSLTRKNAIVEYLDYQIPVTQLKGPKGNWDMQAAKRD